MKTYKFETYKDFCEQVQKSLNYLKQNCFYGYFFVDANEKEIIKSNGTNFLEFYLKVFQRICYYEYDEIAQLKSRQCYLFIGNKDVFIKSLKERTIYKNKLGKNFDNYDLEYTDDVFQIINKINLNKWLDRFTI